MKCKTCGTESPEIFSNEWNKSKWMVIMRGADFGIVFCPLHHDDGEKYWKDYCEGMVNLGT